MAETLDTAPVVGGFLHPLNTLRGTGPGETGPTTILTTRPDIRRIDLADLGASLAEGWRDFAAHRTDVMMLCVLYPVIGLVLLRAAIGYEVLALLFPLAAGFALLGPLAATGIYEMNRRMEAGEAVSWHTVFAVARARGIGAVLVLGLLFVALFVVWLQVALAIYQGFLGDAVPPSVNAFLAGVFGTHAGWRMIVAGDLAGLLFAIVALAVGTFAFPMLIDGRHGRTTGERLSLAVGTSLRAAWKNPLPVAVWGLVVAAGLVLGTIPFFLGLVVVLPVLWHATWHLYRRVVA